MANFAFHLFSIRHTTDDDRTQFLCRLLDLAKMLKRKSEKLNEKKSIYLFCHHRRHRFAGVETWECVKKWNIKSIRKSINWKSIRKSENIINNMIFMEIIHD